MPSAHVKQNPVCGSCKRFIPLRLQAAALTTGTREVFATAHGALVELMHDASKSPLRSRSPGARGHLVHPVGMGKSRSPPPCVVNADVLITTSRLDEEGEGVMGIRSPEPSRTPPPAPSRPPSALSCPPSAAATLGLSHPISAASSSRRPRGARPPSASNSFSLRPEEDPSLLFSRPGSATLLPNVAEKGILLEEGTSPLEEEPGRGDPGDSLDKTRIFCQSIF